MSTPIAVIKKNEKDIASAKSPFVGGKFAVLARKGNEDKGIS